MLLLVVTALLGVAGTIAGALTVRTWAPENDPDYFRDTVHQGVVAFLKLGLLLLLITVGAIGVVGSLNAHRDGTTLGRGVWVCAVLAWIIAVCFIVSYLRQRSRARR